MNKNKRIGIIPGGAGWYNFGDDAQLYNNIQIFKKKGYKSLFLMSPKSYLAKFCDLEKVYPSFHVAFPPKQMREDRFIIEKALRMYYVSFNFEKRKHLLDETEKKVMEFLKKMYVIFVSGSGTINTRSLYGVVLTLLPCLIANNFHKRVIYSGQGVLPLNHLTLEPLISYTFNQASLVTTRDFELGEKALKKINVNMKNVVLSVDDAFTTIPKYSKRVRISENTIVINISKWLTKNKYEEIYQLAQLLKSDGYNVVFNIFQNEEKLAKIVTKEKFPIYNFSNINPEEVAFFYSKVIASIGMRYHSMIFALAGGNPVINIFKDNYQKSKIEAIRQNTNLPDCMIPYSDLTAKIAYRKLKEAIKSQPEIIKKLNIEWRRKANLAINFLEKLK